MADDTPENPTDARAALAAGALFWDDQGRVMLVRPTYKPYWDIPGGYAMPGESPRDACEREISEELGLSVNVGDLLVVDWAPHPTDGDKLLFVFNCGVLNEDQRRSIVLQRSELAEYRYIAVEELPSFTIPRLTRRLEAAYQAARTGRPAYLELGQAQRRTQPPSDDH